MASIASTASAVSSKTTSTMSPANKDEKTALKGSREQVKEDGKGEEKKEEMKDTMKEALAKEHELVKGKDEIVFKSKTVVFGIEIKDSKVQSVHWGSDFLGKLFMHDILDTVCGEKAATTAEFEKIVKSKIPGKVVFEFRRDEQCHFAMKDLPARRDKYEMYEISLKWRSGGTPIGLLIHRDFSQQVVIAMVDSGATVSKAIRAGDLLYKVNDILVKDRDQARKEIMKSINNTKMVTLVLERAKVTAQGAVQSSNNNHTNVDYAPALYAPPEKNVNKMVDHALPADVLEIMEANKAFFMTKLTLPPCLLKSHGDKETAKLEVAPAEPELQIPMDPSTKPLKSTPKRVGS